MNASRLIAGIFLIVAGLALTIVSFVFSEARIVSLTYGIPALVIGVFIIFNKKEDDIEQIKSRRKK